MRYDFRWNQWNVEHIDTHGVLPEEAEYVVGHATRPYPRDHANDTFIVRGETESGQWLQVIYIFDPPGVVYVIHARPLKDNEKRTARRSRR